MLRSSCTCVNCYCKVQRQQQKPAEYSSVCPIPPRPMWARHKVAPPCCCWCRSTWASVRTVTLEWCNFLYNGCNLHERSELIIKLYVDLAQHIYLHKKIMSGKRGLSSIKNLSCPRVDNSDEPFHHFQKSFVRCRSFSFLSSP